ncbi:unnamed protein product [Bursaphelenchus xylophilus]|uniref:(pine wood nematode) hypothetical protein n=1 Tax=Bursaphelenchus xylophilus TaxID=6326 RepID=A0A7I8WKY3_BURXY|nr:unnamed protein product [Bursaphelenchus xylophilus]CAG9106092.1 unnamed protein product [Bursaphelenchus xylophilus]
MIGNFDEEGRTDAAKCLIFPTRPTADTIPELVLTFQAQLMFDINIDEAGSSTERDIHDLLNGNLNILKLQLPTSVTMRKKGRL